MEREKLMVQSYIQDFEKRTECKVLFVTKSGSKLYGTDNELSDTDYKGIFTPTKNQVLLKKDIEHFVRNSNSSKEKNLSTDVDFSLQSIFQFFNLLSKSETGSVDMLFSMFRDDTIMFADESFIKDIKENYKHFLNRNMKSFIGYALGQTKKFGIKGARYDELVKFINDFKIISKQRESDILLDFFPLVANYIEYNKLKYIKIVQAQGPRSNKEIKMVPYISVLGKLFEENIKVDYFVERISSLEAQFGNRTKTIASTESKTDYKAASHSLRISLETKELLETNFIKFPLSQANRIKDIKQGNIDFATVIDEIEEVLARVDELLLNSNLPIASNRVKMNEIILKYLE